MIVLIKIFCSLLLIEQNKYLLCSQLSVNFSYFMHPHKCYWSNCAYVFTLFSDVRQIPYMLSSLLRVLYITISIKNIYKYLKCFIFIFLVVNFL